MKVKHTIKRLAVSGAAAAAIGGAALGVSATTASAAPVSSPVLPSVTSSLLVPVSDDFDDFDTDFLEAEFGPNWRAILLQAWALDDDD